MDVATLSSEKMMLAHSLAKEEQFCNDFGRWLNYCDRKLKKSLKSWTNGQTVFSTTLRYDYDEKSSLVFFF